MKASAPNERCEDGAPTGPVLKYDRLQYEERQEQIKKVIDLPWFLRETENLP